MPVRERQKRKTQRKAMRHAAWIKTNDHGIPIPCVVWDLSEGGARLTGAQSDSLPNVFNLILERNGKSSRHCRIVWRKRPYVGVRFVQADEAERVRDSGSARVGQMSLAPTDPLEFAQMVAKARQAVSGQIRNADVASGSIRKPVATSTVALCILILLASATLLFNVAGIGLADGRTWATAVCTNAANFCAHPGGAEWRAS
jgi:PilZ domain